MGQCMSRKAAGAFAASAAMSQNRPTKLHKHSMRTPDDEENPTKIRSPTDSNKHRPTNNTNQHLTRGVAMSFGFKRRPAPSVAANPTAARRLATIDGNGNDPDTETLTSNIAPTGRSTPKLLPPKKEANATRVSRFGFRQTHTNRQNKVSDLNCPTEFVTVENGNTRLKKTYPVSGRTASYTGSENDNRNGTVKVGIQPQFGKFTLQSTNLPRPEPIRLIETKTAKTLANNNRRVAGLYHTQEETSKDGSLTEDSGVGSHISGSMGDKDPLPGLEQLQASPAFGARRRNNNQIKPRNLEVVVTSKNTFDVRDMDDSNDSCDSIPPLPLPQLPSAFSNSPANRKPYQSSSLVRERTLEYQKKQFGWDNRGRKISVTSSEGFSDDYGEEEKTYKDLFRSEKTFIKSTPPHQTFLKSRTNQLKDDSSPPSSDEHEWGQGGEAMADEISFSLSSSDESKDNKKNETYTPVSTGMIESVLQNLLNSSMSNSMVTSSPKDVKNVMLTIEDPKFAAVAAASNSGALLDDETLISPVDSISCSETEEIKKKFQNSSSNSKDINEKCTPSSPGTPTNTSNSLSLSDGKDDFLIDDEIADQPSLVFEDTAPPNNDNNISRNNSEATPTLVESVDKPKRKIIAGFEGSPLSARNKKLLQSRTGSLDTLSPCESIASDDLMMDYDYSQSSGLDEFDRQSSGYPSLNETLVNKQDTPSAIKRLKDWNPLRDNYVHSEKLTTSHAPRPRLLRSRGSTPNSVPDSPRSLESRPTRISRPSTTTCSPTKSNIRHLNSTNYDSDDSVRLDRVNHTAMKQDIMSIKTMLLKLRRVLNETDGDILLRSETHNPFENQAILTNGIFNSLCDLDSDTAPDDNDQKAKIELAELRRQILFLQGQLEDKEKTVQSLQEQMIKLTNENYHANSAPASTVSADNQMCNAATQTERCD